MVINIRGTNGSGKSTIVKEVMLRCLDQVPIYVDGRERPLGYRCARENGGVLFVPGHYETACGGCDSLDSPVTVFRLVQEEAEKGHDVLFEGIISQDSVSRLIELAGQFDVRVIALDVPIDDCLADVAKRRARRGTNVPLNPKNTVNRVRSVESSMRRLISVKIPAFWLNREAALVYCLTELNIRNAPRDEVIAGGLF